MTTPPIQEVPDLEMGILNTAAANVQQPVNQEDTEMKSAPLSRELSVIRSEPAEPKFELMQLKDTPEHRACLYDELVEQKQDIYQSESTAINLKTLSQLPVLEQAATLADSITQLIKGKNEPVGLMSLYNKLLDCRHTEIIEALASENQEKRGLLIGQLFTQLIKITQKETYIQKHLYLKHIILFYRLTLVRYFIPLMRDINMCAAVNKILYTQSPLFRSLTENSSMSNYGAAKDMEQNKVKWLNQLCREQMSTQTPEDAEWRNNIKKGDYIDAVCQFQTPNTTNNTSKFLQGWSPAKVDLCDGEGNLLVSFLRCPRSSDIKVNRNSNRIAPAGKYTDRWAERFGIKVDDEFSCCDDYGNWYRSTCLKVEEVPDVVDIEKQPIVRVKVAFRYLDTWGQKEDDKGRKVTGWISNKFDTDMILAMPNIQEVFGLTYQYFNVGPNMSIYDINIADLDDMIYPSVKIHQWCRSRPDYYAGITAIADSCNEFGQLGGFEAIQSVFEQIAAGHFEVTSKYLLVLQNFLFRTLPLWTRQFVCRNANHIASHFMRACTSDKSSVIRNIDQEQIGQLTVAYEQILKRNFLQKRQDQKATQLKIKLGATLLLSENLQKRINGIKIVTDEIRILQRYNNTQEQKKKVMKDFIEMDLFSQVFHPSRLHLQIVQRSQEVIKLFALSNCLTTNHIDQLWQATLIDETAQIEVYRVIEESANVIQDDILEMFISKIQDGMEPSKTTIREVNFIHAIGKSTHYKSAARQKALSALWQIALLEKPYPKALLKPARDHLFDLLRSQDREIVEEYIMRCVQIIELMTCASVQATKLVIKLLDSDKIPKYVYQNQHLHTSNLSQFIKNLCINHNLIDKILNDLENYVLGKGLDEGFGHKKAVWSRLSALLFIQNSADDKTILKAIQVQRAWNMLFNDSSDASDTSLFFDWFNLVISNQEWSTTNNEMVCELFSDQVLNNQNKILSQAMHINGFQCIQQLFLQVNERANNLNITTKAASQPNSTKLYDQSKQGVKKQKIEFRVHLPPTQLIGMEMIWQFFSKSCEVQDSGLRALITQFIAQIYGSISQLISKEINRIYEEFTEQCFSRMRSVLEQVDQPAHVKSELVKSTMLILYTFFQDTEKYGTASIRPHKALGTEVCQIENLLFTSYLSTHASQPKHLLLNVPDNMTVWELIDYIARKTNKSPCRIQCSRAGGKPELKPQDYCRSLKQMQFQSGEEITVIKTTMTNQKVPLINLQTGLLVREAQYIFEGWFNKYSIPAEELSDPEKQNTAKRYMTKEKAVEFLQNAMSDSSRNSAAAANKSRPPSVDDQRIQALFATYDTDRDDMLTVEDFIRFYRVKSNDTPETVWLNLAAHGYGNNLMRDVRGEVTYENDPIVVREQSQLPRSVIAENTAQLEMLFNLESDDQQANDNIWMLISQLKTNSEIYRQVANGENILQMLSPDKSALKLLYILQIVKHLLSKLTSKEQNYKPSSTLYLERAKVLPQLDQHYNDEFPRMDDGQKSSSHHQQLESIEEEKPVKFLNLGAPKIATGEVIALPAAENANNKLPQPEKLTYNQQQIQQWKGDVIKEIIPLQSYVKPEQGSWLIEFLSNGGFQALVNLLAHFTSVNRLAVSSIDRQCVSLITQIVKVLLMATFCANSSDQELIKDLTRKMSSQSQGATQQLVEAQTLIESTQKEIQKEFQPVVEQLELYQFKPEQLLQEDPQMKQFKVLLQRTIQAVLGPRSISDEEILIVGECLNIWISMISHSSERLIDLYQDKSYLDLLIDQGLLSDNLLLRQQFKEAILFVCYRIKQNSLPEAPSIFFLRVLLGKLRMICAQKNSKTQQYFALLSDLIDNYYKLKITSPLIFKQVFDPVELTKATLELLNVYQSTESRNKPQVDQTLVGLLVLVRNLMTHEPEEILTMQEKSIVLNMLVEKCLFNQQKSEVSEHITSEIDFLRLSETTLNKCHSDESRDATYSLFQVLIGQNPDIQVSKELLAKYWVPSIIQLSASKSHQFASKDRDNRSELGYAGLKNLGCICYMNACIQQLFNVPAFRYCLLAANDGKDLNLVNVNGREVDDNQLHQWQRMFGALELTERESYNPEDFCYSFKRGGQPVNVREQQDAQEFVGYAFDKIEESLKHTPFRHLMDQFQGLNTNITICKNCFNIVQTDQAFATLQLTVKNQKSIYDSLRLMTAGELIQDYNCSNCEQKVEIKRCSTIKRLPNTLIVHLQRLVFDFDTMAQKKLNDRVEFPNVLNVQEFMLDEVIQSIKRDKKQLDVEVDGDEIMEEKADPTCFEYKLVGVVIHMGTADAGHYISYVNIERSADSSVNTEQWLQTEKQQWLEFNDNQVKPFDFSQLAFKAFGEQQQSKGTSQIQTSNTDFQEEATQAAQASHNAYMLVYEKRVKEPLKLVLEEQTISKIKSLACDGTTIPRELAQEQLPFEFVAVPSLLHKVLSDQYVDNTVEISVSEVRKFVPNAIYSQVNRDNQLHITESQVCCNPFFKTTAILLNNLVKHCDAADVLCDVYTIVDRLIFDLLIRTTQNAELENIAAILLGLVQNQPELLLRLVNERILFTQKVADNVCDQPFFEMLIFHKEQNTREMCEKILTKVTDSLFEMLEYPALRALTEDQLTFYSEMLEKIVEVAVSVIPGKITNAWHKLGPFFNFLFNVIKEQKMNRLVMFRKNRLVSRLVELICKIKDHFQNGYNYGAPPVEFAIRTFALIVRSQPLLIWLYKIPLNKQVSIDEYEQVIADGGKSPYHLGQHNFYLDPEDLRNIFMTEKRVKHLWELCLQYAGSVEAIREVSLTIAHLCYRNYDFSRKFAKLLLAGLNKTQAEEVKPFAICMQQFLTIADEFQMHRLDWILGFPSITMQRSGNNYYNQDASNQQYKIGCNKIQNVDDLLYDYQTPMLKDQSQSAEPVLQILYKFRKSGFSEVVLVLLDHLLEAALINESPILAYLLNNQGPSYTCRRYWDWIEPFILNNIQECYNNASAANNGQSAELNFRILDHIQKLKESHAKTIEEIKGPEPYLHWDIIDTKEIQTYIYNSKLFHVVLQEITTTISKSTPNPAEGINENIQKVNKSGWQQSQFKAVQSKRKRVAKKSRQQLTKATKYGRGSRAANDQNAYRKRDTDAEPERTVWDHTVTESDMDYNRHHPQDDDNFHDYDNNMPTIQMRDSGQDAPLIQGLNQDVQMDEIGQNPDDEHWSDKLNQSSDQEFDQSYSKLDSTRNNNYTMAADQIGVFGDVIEQVQDSQNTQEPADQKLDGVNQDSAGESDEDDEEETQKYQVETILQVMLRNFHRTKQQTCRFQFDPDKEAKCNYFVPTAELYQKVNTQTDYTFVRFTKLNPYQGWGPLKFKFFVDDEDLDGRNTKYDRNWLALRNLRNQVDESQFQEVPQPVSDQEINYDDGGSVPYTGFGGVESGVIKCQVCTFDNEPSLSRCEMCDSPLT